MFQEFLDSIVQSTQSQYIAPILKLCGYGEIAHFYKFTDDSIDLIEKYVQNRLSAMPVEERAPIIGNEFADFPAYFMFTPIFRINLVKTISHLVKQFDNKISKISKNRNNRKHTQPPIDEIYEKVTFDKPIVPVKVKDCDENRFNGDSDLTLVIPSHNLTHNFSHNFTESSSIYVQPEFTRNKKSMSIKIEEIVENTSSSLEIPAKQLQINPTTSDSSNVEKPNETEKLYKSDAPNSAYEKVLNNFASKFPDTQLERGKDFDLEEWYDKETNKRVYGAYLCRFCEKKDGKEKRIRFSYIGQSSIIYTNIQTHLKMHIGKGKFSRKRRWTTANLEN